MNINKQTVFVGLSGGVDSSVAALRLKNEGHTVVGVFIKVWQPDFLKCDWEQERLDAMRVAAHLDIPFLTCDAAETYRTEVGEYFINEYKNGRTPNPDVMCNSKVKFGAFLKFALEKGADYIATGHYAQKIGSDRTYVLKRGADVGKDQSYFLWTLTQQQLQHVLFPVGCTAKIHIREEAKKAHIPIATKKDSQGVCFLGYVDIPEFMNHFIDLQEGEVLNEAGDVIGTHRGSEVYTVGQRHGFSITNNDVSTLPHYVIKKNLEKNTVTVSSTVPKVASRTSFTVTDMNWINEIPANEAVLEAQFRYRQKPFEVTITNCTEHTATVTPHTKVEVPALGQSCVLYRGEICLGGGTIS